MQKYNCKNCGAELYWDSNANCLKCEYCDAEYQASEFDIEEREGQAKEAEDEHVKATDDSESEDLVVYQCSHCGAEIITARSTVATTCAYCGRAIAMTSKMVNEFKPDVVIPFSCDEEQAKKVYKKYIHSSFLTPKDFKAEETIKKIRGVYVPYWLHSFTNRTKALVYGENVTSHRRGDDKVVEHHMYHIKIDAQGRFENMPTDALKNLDNTLMDALEPFDYQKLEAFNPAYMAGFYAEEYNEDEEATINRVTQRANQTMAAAVQKEAGVYGVKYIKDSSTSITDRDSRYAMLPVWLLNVEYKTKDYLFAINGQTGKIVGQLPMSIKKLVLTAATSFSIVFLLMMIYQLAGGTL